MSRSTSFLLTTLAMIAFAANSLLCRAALRGGHIDAASFTTLRLLSGAALLWAVVWWRGRPAAGHGSWKSAGALFVYAAGFSYAYLSLPTATGAFLLFGAVQVTMIGYGLCAGERLGKAQWAGLVIALTGLVGLLLPTISAPPIFGAVLMLVAGAAWGVYSLRGKNTRNPTGTTARNFLCAVLPALILSGLSFQNLAVDAVGIVSALASGALASGLGYVLWYAVLPTLSATGASIVQLSVPVLAALGGVALLNEQITLRMVLASCAILGGIALVLQVKAVRREV